MDRSIKSGYDLPLYGMQINQFYTIHVLALVCIYLSLISAVFVVITSFKHQNICVFFNWTKSERFIVYLAICDGMFNICHSLDHLHILITKNHIYPKTLCKFYGFMLIWFISAQNLMVHVVAINAFVLIYFRKKLNFGRYDWKLLLWTVGVAFLAACIALSIDSIGPNGAACYFDTIKGKFANIFFTTIPLLFILTGNLIMYLLTWYRIRKEETELETLTENDAHIIRASHVAARNMSLFVGAFFVQWFAMTIYGVWLLIGNVPLVLLTMLLTFSNIGGILNGIVYIIIRRSYNSVSGNNTI